MSPVMVNFLGRMGTADYDAWVGINHHMIWKGSVNGHVRSDGGAKLLRLIADRMDKDNA